MRKALAADLTVEVGRDVDTHHAVYAELVRNLWHAGVPEGAVPRRARHDGRRRADGAHIADARWRAC
ncbi:hypothetical protein AB5I41_15890 [Sphingomonas sp. MMS24-JH45]